MTTAEVVGDQVAAVGVLKSSVEGEVVRVGCTVLQTPFGATVSFASFCVVGASVVVTTDRVGLGAFP